MVTSLDAVSWPAQQLYEELYCERGEAENRIKEQLSLFSDHMSSETLRANQLRLYLSTLAYVMMVALRRLGLKGTIWERAQTETIRRVLLKIGTQVKVSVRRVSEAAPDSIQRRTVSRSTSVNGSFSSGGIRPSETSS